MITVHLLCQDYSVLKTLMVIVIELHHSVSEAINCTVNSKCYLLMYTVPENASIGDSTLVFNTQSICTEAGMPASQFNVNCVGHRCVQIEGIDLIALGITIKGTLSVTISNHCNILLSFMKDEKSGVGKRMNSFSIVQSVVLK